jgi:hypothetical protein
MKRCASKLLPELNDQQNEFFGALAGTGRCEKIDLETLKPRGETSGQMGETSGQRDDCALN